jgi:hypothetical protein
MYGAMILALAFGYGPDEDAAAALALAQRPVEKENVKPKTETYDEAMATANNLRLRVVVSVGVQVRNIDSAKCVAVADSSFKGYPAKCVIVSNTDGSWRATLPATATDDDILTCEQQRTVSRPASPFDNRPAADDNGPWLPVGEQKAVRDMWPEGVPFPSTLKFYRLPKASQVVAAYQSQVVPIIRFTGIKGDADNINREFPYTTSGGMDYAEPGTWRNVTGLAIPEGKRIEAWRQFKPLHNGSNYQDESALFWQFPKGTEVFDVLIRKNKDGSEHIFTVRKRTKVESDKWDDGSSFFPDVDGEEQKQLLTSDSPRTKRLLGSALGFRFRQVPKIETTKVKFKETDSRLAMTDGGHFFPPGFKGTPVSCNKCHSIPSLDNQKGRGELSGEIAAYGGPMLRGMDSVYSWYPTRADMLAVSSNDANPPAVTPIDYRWPVKFLGDYK